MIYCFDIDGTLCNEVGGDYLAAKPFPERISTVNALYDMGHTVLLFTARGATSGIDWEQQTRLQLASWGIRFHQLLMGKPHADVFIDNKATHSESFEWHAYR